VGADAGLADAMPGAHCVVLITHVHTKAESKISFQLHLVGCWAGAAAASSEAKPKKRANGILRLQDMVASRGLKDPVREKTRRSTPTAEIHFKTSSDGRSSSIAIAELP
jgi:hypothetical protein